MVILLVLAIPANAELVLPDDEEVEVEVLEPPRLPAAVPEDDPDEDVVAFELDVDALPVEPADTVSPGERLASETIVPLVGA